MMDPCEGKDTRADRLRRRSLEEQGRGKTRRGEILHPQKAGVQDDNRQSGDEDKARECAATSAGRKCPTGIRMAGTKRAAGGG